MGTAAQFRWSCPQTPTGPDGQVPTTGTVAHIAKLPTLGNLAIWATSAKLEAMVVTAEAERAILEQGMVQLAGILGPDFEVAPYQVDGTEEVEHDDIGADAVYSVRAVQSSAPYAQLIVEARSSLAPAAAKDVLFHQVRLLRRLHGQATGLVIAPWLSPRTREVLVNRKISFLDLTGNIDLHLPRNGILIRTDGAQRDPNPTPRRRSRGLSGASAGIVTRTLVDFKPPYRQKDVAAVAGVSPGYVSRVFQALDDEALITRDGHVITDVEWQSLLRARAENYDVLRSNHAVPMVSRKSPEMVYRSLVDHETKNTTVVTGSYAAREIAPIAVGGPLMIYVDPMEGARQIDDLAEELSLLRAGDAPGNIILLRPQNRGPLLRFHKFGATARVGLSQLVMDCLSGPGRMAQEAEAVLAYMAANESKWRRGRGQLAEVAASLA